MGPVTEFDSFMSAGKIILLFFYTSILAKGFGLGQDLARVTHFTSIDRGFRIKHFCNVRIWCLQSVSNKLLAFLRF